MRAKALLLAAAVSAAALTAVSAATYSVNVVGYINVTIPAGFSMVANQLDNGDGNNVRDLFAVPDAWAGVTLYKYVPTSGNWDILTYDDLDQNWLPTAVDFTLAPGEAAFIANPTGGELTATFVGEVQEGNLVVDTPQGFSVISSVVPQAGSPLELGMTEAAGFAAGDTIYRFNNATGEYDISTYDDLDLDWLPPLPSPIEVGQGFWINKIAAGQWTRDFTVPRE
jgi:hypothetical protein